MSTWNIFLNNLCQTKSLHDQRYTNIENKSQTRIIYNCYSLLWFQSECDLIWYTYAFLIDHTWSIIYLQLEKQHFTSISITKNSQIKFYINLQYIKYFIFPINFICLLSREYSCSNNECIDDRWNTRIWNSMSRGFSVASIYNFVTTLTEYRTWMNLPWWKWCEIQQIRNDIHTYIKLNKWNYN